MRLKDSKVWLVGMGTFLLLMGAMVSCDEELPAVIMTEEEKPLLDTFYLGSVPSASPKKVLLFDVTGVRCNNCPKAAALAKNLLASNAGRLEVVALYPKTPTSLTYPWTGFDTMSTIEADQIATALGGITSLPLGAVDQVSYNGSKLLNTSDWSAAVTAQLSKSSPFNLELKSTWKSAEGRARVEVKAVANSAIAGSYKWVMAITESAVKSKQSDQDAPGGVVEDYEHEHALRGVVGSALGSDINTNAVSAGYVREKHFYITPKSKWNPVNCDVVVWILDANTKEVVQVNHVSMK
ncbi:MAG: Omp28-related outer membrane protein [Sphingomonadales bacterium]|nr:Omp28-related outer membrane protein [Sphingomonadales bacterium]